MRYIALGSMYETYQFRKEINDTLRLLEVEVQKLKTTIKEIILLPIRAKRESGKKI